MMDTVDPTTRKGFPMGFQLPDVLTLGQEISSLRGVSGVYYVSRDEHDATMWVTVRGFDPDAALDRQRVYGRAEKFFDDRGIDMRHGAFSFEYFVLVDEEDLGDPDIPAEAQRVA